MNKRINKTWAGFLVAVARLCGWASDRLDKASSLFLEKAILPCPKCGGPGKNYFEQGMESMMVIQCENCEYSAKGAWDDLPKAIRLWNENR